MLRRFPIIAIALAPIAVLTIGSQQLASAAEVGGGGSHGFACPVLDTIEITHLAFKPASVASGHSSTAYLVARNCTDKALDTNAMWEGTFLNSNGTPVSGCPVLDPFSEPANFEPAGTLKSKATFEAPVGCKANVFQLTVTISADGETLARRDSDLKIIQASSGG